MPTLCFPLFLKEGKHWIFSLYKRFEFVAPEFLMVEIKNHADEIVTRTGLSIEKLGKVLTFLEKEIEFVPFEEFTEFYEEADRISPDPDDVQYFALALKLKGAIWSNDKALKRQSAVEVFSTGDLLKLL